MMGLELECPPVSERIRSRVRAMRRGSLLLSSSSLPLSVPVELGLVVVEIVELVVVEEEGMVAHPTAHAQLCELKESSAPLSWKQQTQREASTQWPPAMESSL